MKQMPPLSKEAMTFHALVFEPSKLYPQSSPLPERSTSFACIETLGVVKAGCIGVFNVVACCYFQHAMNMTLRPNPCNANAITLF